MRPATIVRAVTLVGMLVAGWSMVVRWGDIGKGPPAQWERQVVGALTLCLIALVALAVMGPVGARRSWIARVIALVASAGAVAIALLLRKEAGDAQVEHLLEGPGWTWLAAGGGFSLAAAVGALAIAADARAKPGAGGRRKRRKRP
jgi:hypothetical protein